MRRDVRTLAQVLAEPRWLGLVEPAQANGLTVEGARAVDRLLVLAERDGTTLVDQLTEDQIREAGRDAKTEDFYVRLVVALRQVFSGARIVQIAEGVARDFRARRRAGNRPRKGRKTVSRYSVPEYDLPLAWQSALCDMRDRIPSECGTLPAIKVIPTIADKLRQLAHAAKVRGLPVALSNEVFDALEEDLQARQVAPRTLQTTFAKLGIFAQFLGFEPAVLERLSSFTCAYGKLSAKSGKRKEAHLHRLGSSPGVAMRKARELLGAADRQRDPRRAKTGRNEALALALFTAIPLRLSDTRLVFGVNLLWTGEAYEIGLRTSKNEVDFTTTVDHRLDPFIDAVLLDGLDRAYLDKVRHAAMSSHRPLFTTVSGTGVAEKYVSACWRRHLGTGVHIARSIVHESLEAASGEQGTAAALVLCAQNDPRTAAHYQGQSTRRARVRRSQANFAALADDLPADAWDL